MSPGTCAARAPRGPVYAPIVFAPAAPSVVHVPRASNRQTAGAVMSGGALLHCARPCSLPRTCMCAAVGAGRAVRGGAGTRAVAACGRGGGAEDAGVPIWRVRVLGEGRGCSEWCGGLFATDFRGSAPHWLRVTMLIWLEHFVGAHPPPCVGPSCVRSRARSWRPRVVVAGLAADPCRAPPERAVTAHPPFWRSLRAAAARRVDMFVCVHSRCARAPLTASGRAGPKLRDSGVPLN